MAQSVIVEEKERLNELKGHARWLYARIKDREYELEETKRTIKRIKSLIKEYNEELTATEEEIEKLEKKTTNKEILCFPLS